MYRHPKIIGCDYSNTLDSILNFYPNRMNTCRIESAQHRAKPPLCYIMPKLFKTSHV